MITDKVSKELILCKKSKELTHGSKTHADNSVNAELLLCASSSQSANTKWSHIF